MYINITKKEIDIIFENRNHKRWNKNIDTYIFLMKNLSEANNNNDIRIEYQRKFNYFYQVRRNQEWRNEFYKLFYDCSKSKDCDFEKVLKTLYEKTGNIEASFSSKFMATINSDLPIIDSHILSFLGEKLPVGDDKEKRIKQIIELYKKMEKEFANFFKNSSECKYLLEKFSFEYPTVKISNMKMLDFVLWQSGGKKKI